jgi:beta-phosphoglucomutase-like phosphatase (HAD superfamily)
MLRQLDEAGVVVGVISYSLSGVVNALIAPVRAYFKGAIWGIDRSERFDKDVERYLAAATSAQAEPERCLIVDDQPLPLLHAKQAGMQTLHVDRSSETNSSLAAACAALIESLRSPL